MRTSPLSLFLLLGLQVIGYADMKAGTRVPAATAANQELISGVTAPFPWTLGTRPYTTTGTAGDLTTTFPGPLNVNPTQAAENGLTVKMPSGATGNAIQGLNSTGNLLWAFDSSGNLITDFGLNNLHIGQSSSAGSGGGSLALGVLAHASGYNSFAVGFNSTAGQADFALGPSVSATGNSDIVIGSKISCSLPNLIVMGYGDLDGPSYKNTALYFNGTTTAYPTPFLITNAAPTASNTAGAGLTIAGSKSTGTAIGGPVYLATSSTGSAGAGLNALVNRVQVDSTSLTLVNGTHLITSGTTPTAAAGANAAAAAIVTGSTDTAGNVTETAIASPTAAAKLITVTFATAYGSAPKVVQLQATNAATASLGLYVQNVTATGFDIYSAAAPAASASLAESYLVIQ